MYFALEPYSWHFSPCILLGLSLFSDTWKNIGSPKCDKVFKSSAFDEGHHHEGAWSQARSDTRGFVCETCQMPKLSPNCEY